MARLILVALSFFIIGCGSQKTESFTTDKAMVVSARIEASQIGADIMRKGGNAFDAMVATELALAVVYPYAGNISGGGFMVYRKADGTTGALDYRERAPMASTKDMFLDENGNPIPDKSTDSALSVGVPGTVAGIFEAHRKFGSLPMKELIQPAIDLAKNGFVVTQKQLEQLEASHQTIVRQNGATSLYAKSYRVGDTIRNPKLAETLERIAQNGRDDFYSGTSAKLLIDYLQKRGGIMTLEDLSEYKAVWRDPIVFDYKNFTLISMSPPSSGGICLAQILKMIEPFPIAEYGHNSEKYIQVLTEAERRAYADRSHYLGDPDFVAIPKNELLSTDYLSSRMKEFSLERATPSAQINPGNFSAVESNETTHYSIIDPFGNAVSVTTTLNGAFGSKLFCEELGVFLNNEMDDFSSKPGTPNQFGLVGSSANAIAPGKRMLSSMTPTIVEKDGKFFMVLGTPGGSTIITSVLQTFLNVVEFGMPMQKAVASPRFHHQWLPDVIFFERGKFASELLENLKAKGYTPTQNDFPIIGKVDAILVEPNGKISGGADPRGDDAAAGF